MRGDSPSRQVRSPQLGRGPAEDLLGGLRQQALAGAVDEPQRLRAVEGEDRDVNLHHHGAQQRARLESAKALIVQRRGEDVHFEHDRTQGIVAAGAACADGEVALAQCREEVRQRLQRQYHAMPYAERTAGPHADDEHRQRPLHLGGVRTGPEQDEGDERRRQSGDQRQQQDALVEAQTGVGTSGENVVSQLKLGIRNSELGINS
jgi:hypothetical protein